MGRCRVVVASVDYVEASRLARLVRSNEINECMAVELKDDELMGNIAGGAPDLIMFAQADDEEQRLNQIQQIRQQTTAGTIIVALYRAHDFSRLGALAGASVSSCVRKSPIEKELGEAIRG